MSTIEEVFDDLRRRVEALEKAQATNAGTLKWISGTLGQEVYRGPPGAHIARGSAGESKA